MQFFMEEQNLSSFMDGSIKNLFQNAVQINWRNPRQALFPFKAAKEQQAAAPEGMNMKRRGFMYPPL